MRDDLDRAIESLEHRQAKEADARAIAAEVTERLVDARLDFELHIRAPWLTADDRRELVAETREEAR